MVDQPSLDGLTVGVTADRRAHEELELLAAHGATVLHGPTITSAPASREDNLRLATLGLLDHPPDVFLASSGLGVRAWFSAADVWGIGAVLRSALARSRVVTIGAGADRAIGDAGLAVSGRLRHEHGGLLVAELDALGVAGRRVAVDVGDLAAGSCRSELAAAGAIVIEIPVGDWSLPSDIGPARRLVEAVIEGRVNAITFTSAPAVRNLLLIAEEASRAGELLAALNGGVVAMCVGPVCATAARRCGIVAPAMPPKYRLGAMVKELATVLAANTREFWFAGHRLVFRGSVLELDTARIELDDREAAVLRALVVRPGVAVSRRQLLAEVWGDRQRDDHVVEAAVRRLRRHLGTCADLVITVPRRGYCFTGAAA